MSGWKNAKKIASSATFRDTDFVSKNSVYKQPPYEIKPVPGKGLGVIANETIHRGEKLFSEPAVFIVRDSDMNQLPNDVALQMLAFAADSLPNKTREMYLSLHGFSDIVDVEPAYDRLQGNAYSVDGHSTVFPEISRINHDCRPNSHYYTDQDAWIHTVVALKTIQPGEEVTVSYLSPYMRTYERAAKIPLSWGFNCTCPSCAAARKGREASDERLNRIINIEKMLSDVSPGRRGSPAAGERLISLYEQEHFHGPIALGYTYTALEYSYIGDLTMTKKYAKKAYEMELTWF
ncbi:hypothetical protein LTS18_001763, partial [Coniosporium uncinatum]